MKFAYKFSNLLGTIYHKGNALFTSDGNSVISPVGNRLTIYDLKNNKSNTLSLGSNYNYTAIGLSPNGCLMVAVNEKGQAEMISLISQTVIYTHYYKDPVSSIQFSPDGKYFAVAHGTIVTVYYVPGDISGNYGNFMVYRHFGGAHDDITWIDWTTDSKVLAIGSRDNTTRLVAPEFYENFRPYSLAGHTDGVVGCYFEQNSLDLYTVSRNGQLCIWECAVQLNELTPKQFVVKEIDVDADEEQDDEIEDKFENGENRVEPKEEDGNDDGRDEQGKLIVGNEEKPNPFQYSRLARHYLINEVRKVNAQAQLTAANYHKGTKLLVTAYSTGAFYLHEMPDVNLIHSLSITDYAIQTVCFNNTGDWITLGSANLGQLLVWEWQSEQYVMKQQGHSSEMNCISYSTDGQNIVTGGEDGKVKVWNVGNGFCFVTFAEHSGAVTALEFSANKKFVVSASLDGTVRAYDLIRYRNFRTFTSPRPVQFAGLALDSSGELVAASGNDVFEVYLWSMKLGRLLEVLSGHEGPIASLAFAPVATSSMLVSGSWDKTIRIWNCLETSGDHETVDIMSSVTAVAFKPDGEEVAVASLSGTIQVFNIRSSAQVSSIEGRNDLGVTVSETDLTSGQKNKESRYFSTMAYSADGETILAGGKSKFVCIYHASSGLLLKKFEITQNFSLDGLHEFINRRNLTEFGNMALVENRDVNEGGNVALRLPGVRKGDMASRNYKPEVQVFSVRFAPSAQSYAAATTEGLLIYSLDRGVVFDPLNLSLEVTPKAAREHLQECNYSTALLMALKINEVKLIEEIIEQIPYGEVKLVAQTLPEIYVERLVEYVGRKVSASPHVQFYLHWSTTLLTTHAAKENVLKQQTLIAVQDSLTRKYESLSKICDFNKYTLKVLADMRDVTLNEAQLDEMDADDDSDAESLILKRAQSNDDDDDDDQDEMESEDDSDDE